MKHVAQFFAHFHFAQWIILPNFIFAQSTILPTLILPNESFCPIFWPNFISSQWGIFAQSTILPTFVLPNEACCPILCPLSFLTNQTFFPNRQFCPLSFCPMKHFTHSHFSQFYCSLSFCPLLFCQIDHFAKLFYEGTEYSKTCFGRFWITFQMNFASVFHLCLRNAGKTLPELTFSRGYRALKNTFWQVLSHISEINFTTIFQSCLRNGGKRFQSWLFHESTEHPKTRFGRFWATLLKSNCQESVNRLGILFGTWEM